MIEFKRYIYNRDDKPHICDFICICPHKCAPPTCTCIECITLLQKVENVASLGESMLKYTIKCL